MRTIVRTCSMPSLAIQTRLKTRLLAPKKNLIMSSSLLEFAMRDNVEEQSTTSPSYFDPSPYGTVNINPHNGMATNTPALRYHADDRDNTAMWAPTTSRTPAIEPCFIPGHIRVDHQDRFAAMVPLQILPAQHYGTHWTAENLSWDSFVRLTEQKLDTTLLRSASPSFGTLGSQGIGMLLCRCATT